MNVHRTVAFFVLLSLFVASAMVPSMPRAIAAAALPVVDNFEAPLVTNGQAGAIPIGFFVAKDPNPATTTTFGRSTTPPVALPGSPVGNNVLKTDFNVVSYGVVIHAFENAAVNEWVTQDWSPYAGMSFWIYGSNSGTRLFIDVLDNRNDDSTTDDAERYSVEFLDNFSGWQLKQFPFNTFNRKNVGNGAPNDGFTLSQVHGWAFGAVATAGNTYTYYLDDVQVYGVAPPIPLAVSLSNVSYAAQEGSVASAKVKLTKIATHPVTVSFATAPAQATPGRDYTSTSGTVTIPTGQLEQSIPVTTLEDGKYEGDEGILISITNPISAELGVLRTARIAINDNEIYDPLLLNDFEGPSAGWDSTAGVTLTHREIMAGDPQSLPGQGAYEGVLDATYTGSGAAFGRTFAQGIDLRGNPGMSFWYYGRNTGQPVTMQLLDNSAADPGPTGWNEVWSDEFNTAAGTAPNPENWTHEIGDGTANGNVGWGNDELEYYTNSTDNAATDGTGNLVITTRDVSGTTSLHCYYGPCQYTSARLLTTNKAEFAYGKIESRIKVPRGAGLWPAFWSLGTDIAQVGWPQTGEIDIMEFVGREPKQVFGTIHGPGYAGGQSFGSIHTFAADVPDDFHTFRIEWQPNLINWYVDNILYHTAEPSDVAPDEWVFNHPFFLLLNVAVGGNFGGPVGNNTVFPQEMKVDYVRVYQADDSAERFESSFNDDFTGWQKIELPFSSFTRSGVQPPDAPNDGLSLNAVRGYRFVLPTAASATVSIDQVRVISGCENELTVTSSAASGPGSLPATLGEVCASGVVRFAPSLANSTIVLTADLTLESSVTIDGSDAPGLAISGADTYRTLVVNPLASATVKAITLTNGYGFQLGGGVLNNGTLTLDHVTVANNRVTTDGTDFWKGGAGIYSGENSTLTVINSTIRDNKVTAGNGGGVYAFFNSTVTISNTTIYSNTTNEVGGGLRLLSNANVVNSTISGNSTTGWHGGAVFHTDGVLNLVNTSVVSNTAPGGTTGGMFVGTFTASNATLTLRNSLVVGNSGGQCLVFDEGAGTVTLSSLGHN
ncbi:MAG: family 16 glycosylhydrolase, partial [Herpetosiphonaceae bacterium]|nr:family 16 glycosylhydrolase [Herpetosiphonaceae bacterium]